MDVFDATMVDPGDLVHRKLLFKPDKKKKTKELWCSCTQVCTIWSFSSEFPLLVTEVLLWKYAPLIDIEMYENFK